MDISALYPMKNYLLLKLEMTMIFCSRNAFHVEWIQKQCFWSHVGRKCPFLTRYDQILMPADLLCHLTMDEAKYCTHGQVIFVHYYARAMCYVLAVGCTHTLGEKNNMYCRLFFFKVPNLRRITSSV